MRNMDPGLANLMLTVRGVGYKLSDRD
jgi:hypothetical protein